MVARMCQWCLNVYDEHAPRSVREQELLRSALLVNNQQYEAMICDTCYNNAVYTAPTPAQVATVPIMLLRSLSP